MLRSASIVISITVLCCACILWTCPAHSSLFLAIVIVPHTVPSERFGLASVRWACDCCPHFQIRSGNIDQTIA
ncbi:hypothetical protein B0H21DRAFT_443090 [Amylocystis lapponica]|nr:hypothetical protein B0H21DRAFT_443090 [Amylocystis lapponica]